MDCLDIYLWRSTLNIWVVAFIKVFFSILIYLHFVVVRFNILIVSITQNDGIFRKIYSCMYLIDDGHEPFLPKNLCNLEVYLPWNLFNSGISAVWFIYPPWNIAGWYGSIRSGYFKFCYSGIYNEKNILSLNLLLIRSLTQELTGPQFIKQTNLSHKNTTMILRFQNQWFQYLHQIRLGCVI